MTQAGSPWPGGRVENNGGGTKAETGFPTRNVGVRPPSHFQTRAMRRMFFYR